ncbi:MAG: nitrilase-related carbon-nitrogen hydrolase [Bifidobacterium choerinum]
MSDPGHDVGAAADRMGARRLEHLLRHLRESGDRTLLRRAGRGHPHQSDRDLPQLRDIDGDGVKDGKGWEWYYRNRLESIASRDGLAIASADLVGADGCADKDGKQPCDFPGGSVIVRGSADYSAGQNADGTLVVGTEGALSNTKDLRVSYPSTTRVANDFHPDYYTKWYAELADRQESDMSLNNRYGSADGPRVAVANVAGVWADKQANVDMMVRYAEQAAADDVDLLVFPETVLTGYDSTDPRAMRTRTA